MNDQDFIEGIVEEMTKKFAERIKRELKMSLNTREEIRLVTVSFSSKLPMEKIGTVLEISDPFEVANQGFDVSVTLRDVSTLCSSRLPVYLGRMHIDFHPSCEFRFEAVKGRVFLRLLKLLGGVLLPSIDRFIHTDKQGNHSIEITFRYRIPTIEALVRLLEFARALKTLPTNSVERLEGLPDSELTHELELEEILDHVIKLDTDESEAE